MAVENTASKCYIDTGGGVGDGPTDVHVAMAGTSDLELTMTGDAQEGVNTIAQVRNIGALFADQRQPQPARTGDMDRVNNVVAVGAGKGGVGKSTMAVLLALSLRSKGRQVGLLDADVYGPSIPMMLGLEGIQSIAADEKIIPVEARGLKVMSMGLLIDPYQPVIWRGPMVHNAVKQLLEQVDWEQLDYLIVDLPPGTGDVPLTLAQSIPLTGAVVVCTGQEVAKLDVRRAIGMYGKLGIKCLGVLENMTYFVAPDTGREYDLFGKDGARALAAECEVPFLGSIPLNVAIRIAGDEGRSAELSEELDAPTQETIDSATARMVAQINAWNIRKTELAGEDDQQ